MSYLDSLPQGMQSAYGGYNQLYKKPSYTQIGQTRVSSPMTLPLGQGMYGTQQELPEVGAGQPTPIAPTPEQGIPETGLQTGAEDYLGTEGSGWEQIVLDGVPQWMPTNVQEGDVYETTDQKRYIWRNGEWVGEGQTMPPPSWGNQNLYNQYINSTAGADDNVSYTDYLEYLRRTAVNQYEQKPDIFGDNPALIQAIDDELALIGQTPEGEVLEPTIVNWQDQLSTFMESMQGGDLTYDAATGTFVDAEGNAQDSWMSTWMSEVIGRSHETGGISGEDFFTIDEDGNITLAEELQTMSDWFDQNDVNEDYARYNRELAAHAIASGKSLNSGYYSEAAANAVSNYAAQQTDQIAKVMTDDITSQFNYIANSILNMMKDIMDVDEKQMFADAMRTQQEALEKKYAQQMQQLAMNAAETDAARFGNILSGVITAIINIIGAAL